jgi:hypothetical protein
MDEGAEPFTFGGVPTDGENAPGVAPPGKDVAGDAASGVIAALAGVGEKIFDIFGGQSPPKREKPEPKDPTKNAFARAAEIAIHKAQAEEEKTRDKAYWEDRDRSRD